ncbi:MAG: glycosyltransferase family 2 protein [Anaerolineae bacterium]|nr:glycosyltransferase family 2 protein [Anaerolineae bacterium]
MTQAVAGDATWPLVSVIIPVHNGEAYLAEAVASIRAQDYPALEIIIVDDGSTDGTPIVVGRLGDDIQYERQAQAGPAAARNRGLTLAGADIVAFLDADDVWPPGKLRAQVGRLLAEPALDVVLGRVQPLNVPPSAASEGVIDVHLGSAVFRRSVFDHVGLFDEGLTYSEDHDWFLRAREQGVRMTVLRQVTLLYRRHDGSLTRQSGRQGYQLPRVLKASLDRRRAQAQGQAAALPRLADFDETSPGPG